MISGSKIGEGFVCDIAAIDAVVVTGEQVRKQFIAKFAPDGPKGEFIRAVSVPPTWALVVAHVAEY